MTNELVVHYLKMGQPQVFTSPLASTVSMVIPALTSKFGANWTWEITDETFVMDGTMVSTTVALYVPGRVLIGRHIGQIKDYATNHLHALLEAYSCGMVRNENLQTQTVPVQSSIPMASQGNMNADQIMSAINATHNPQPVTQAQTQWVPGIPTPENPNADLPFWLGEDDPNAPPEIRQAYLEKQKALQQQNAPQNASQLPQMPLQTPPQINALPQQQTPQSPVNGPQTNIKQHKPRQGNPTPPDSPNYKAPDPRYNGFTQEDMDRMDRVKDKLDILNEEIFNNYLAQWSNNTITNKFGLNPDNVKQFLSWAERLESNFS